MRPGRRLTFKDRRAQSRLTSLGRRAARRMDSATALTIITPTDHRLQSWITRPRAAPAAGGCSVFVSTISTMLRPTVRAATVTRRAPGRVRGHRYLEDGDHGGHGGAGHHSRRVAPDHSARCGGDAVGHDEDSENGRRHGDDYRGVQHDVPDQQYGEEGERCEDGLEGVVEGVALQARVEERRHGSSNPHEQAAPVVSAQSAHRYSGSSAVACPSPGAWSKSAHGTSSTANGRVSAAKSGIRRPRRR